jgi:hypothetical protein
MILAMAASYNARVSRVVVAMLAVYAILAVTVFAHMVKAGAV